MDVLAAAREALREAGTARIRHGLRGLTPDGAADGAVDAVGVADLRARRAHLQGRGAETVLDGDGYFDRFGDDAGFVHHTDLGPTTDALWPLREDIVLAGPVEHPGGARLHDATVARYIAPVAGPRSRALAELWFDDLGRPVLFALAEGLLPQLPLFGGALRRLVSGAFSTADHPVWRTTELWDFGVEAEIRVPVR